MKSFLSWYSLQADNHKAIIAFVSPVICAAVLFLFASFQMSNQVNRAMSPYAESQGLINKYIDTLPKPAHLPVEYFTLFKTQQKIMSLRKTHYLNLSHLFFRNYYGVLILTMIFSCVGGVVLFLLINKGWANASISLKALFLSIALIITFCGFFPLVFKQEENFNQNIQSYMRYTKAELNIVDQLSRLQNPLFPFKTDSVTINSKKEERRLPDSAFFYRQVDSMLTVNTNTINDLTNYVLTINANEIKSIGDVYKTLNNLSTGNPDTTGRKK